MEMSLLRVRIPLGVSTGSDAGETAEDGSSTGSEAENGQPVIHEFTVTQDETDPTLVTIVWNVEGADYIEISPLGGPLSPSGSQQIHLTDPENTISLLARNEAGKVTDQKRVSIAQQSLAERQAYLAKVAEEEATQQSIIRQQPWLKYIFTFPYLWIWLLIVLALIIGLWWYRREMRQ